MFYSVVSNKFGAIVFDKENAIKLKEKFCNTKIKSHKNLQNAINETKCLKSSKFYAVKEGFVPGIYLDWIDCKIQVDGFSGAVYRSFTNIDEMEHFLFNSPVIKAERKKTSYNKKAQYKYYSKGKSQKKKAVSIAYIDGSFNPMTGVYGYGAILFFGEREYKMSGNGREKDKVSMRNVAGEIMGAISVIERAIKIGATKIVICYDYQGIEQFALGNWKRNNAYTKEYYDFIQKAKEKIEIEFEKIKAHTGDVYNEMVDRMAKRAVGI